MRIILFLLILTSYSFANIKEVKIFGNKRVSSNTIEAFVDKKNTQIDTFYINNLTRIIYNTEFFSNVKISYDNNILNISVEENPIINFFYINGITGDDLDEVNKIISLKENNIFSVSKLKKDLEDVKDLFKSSGYYFVVVEPEVIKIDDNQINLILNINKKDISKIKNIYFIGEKYFSSGQLLEIISSAEDSWWSFFSKSSLSEDRVEYDKKLLKSFYKSKGFYDVQIESVLANLDNKNNFTLTYSINSGKKYTFGNIEIKTEASIFKESNISDMKNISEKIIKGKMYSTPAILTIEKQVNTYLEDNKYANIEIDIEEIKKSDEKIDLILKLNSLKKTLIGKINVYGNSITEEKVVRDSLIISEGDILNISKIKKSIDNIDSKNFFKKTDYKITDSDLQKNSKDLNLYVKEQPTGSLSAGIGYGSSGGLLEGSINERNFLGKGIDLNFTGRLASEKVSGVFSYIDPNFMNSEKELANYFFSETDDYSNAGYKSKRIGDRLGTRYEIFEDIYLRPFGILQFDKLETNSNASSLLRSRDGNFTTTTLGFNLLADFRNSKNLPTSGSLSFFDQSYATLISDVPTIQTSVGSTFYQELINEKFIGSAKLKLSNVTAFDNKDIKLSDRLFASASDLRGFEARGVGPIDSGSHVGGNYLAVLNLKSTFPNPIPDILRPKSYLFYDIGNIWGVDYSDVVSESSNLRTSTGIALDVTTPIGPLSFTYSIPLSKASTDKEQRFLFNLGSSF
jgi:outer membrane protein insertion porin family